MKMTNPSEPVDAKCDAKILPKNVFSLLISRVTVLVLMPRPAEG